MRADGRSITGAGSRLTRQVGLLSLAVIAGITLTLAVVLSYYLRRDLLEHEWSVTADFVRTEAAYHLTLADFMEPGTPLARAHFRDFYAQTVLLPEIVRVKIYDAKAQGTGLGLAMARKFTEAYGGTITVHSRVREGATFRVTFPSVAPASGGA